MFRRPLNTIIHTEKIVILSKEEFEQVKLKMKKDQIISVKIVSGSMKPLIQINERVFVQEKKSYDPFDVIIYHNVDGRLICHYIWGKSSFNPGHYLIRSLQGSGFDHPIPQERILGYAPKRKIDFKMKFFILFKLLTNRLRQGVLR